MSKITGNEPVYAAFSINDRSDGREQDGMTVRQRFAMAAMQGLISNPYWIEQEKSIAFERLSKLSCKMADALINELNKSEK